MESQKKVCVTGAGGFVASWLVRLLLSKRYIVHGTMRDPSSEKSAHLSKLHGASSNLKLFKADLLDLESLQSAINGCDGVFHVASPVPSGQVPNPELELIEPAVTGTINVLEACLKSKVRRTIILSSTAAVTMNPRWPKNQIMDETCWSDKEFCRTTQNWYRLSKTEAESKAIEFGKLHDLEILSLCPSMVLGPTICCTMNASTKVLIKLLTEGAESVENKTLLVVDVRDVAEAALLLYENGEAEGRYICSAHTVKTKDMLDILKSKYPDYKYPLAIKEVDDNSHMSSKKLQNLGWHYRPLEQSLFDAVESYQETGMLQ